MLMTAIMPGLIPTEFPLLAIDPGLASGLAWVTVADYKPGHVFKLEISTVTYQWPKQAPAIAQFIRDASVVAMESFRLFPFKAASLSWDELPAPQVIGLVVGLLHLQDKQHYLHTFPSSTTKQVTDSYLQTKIETLPSNRHQRDALRVMMSYLLKQGTR